MKRANLTEHGLVFSHERKTSVKTRVISEGKHQLRIDEEDRHPLQIEDLFLKNTLNLLNDANVVILQDYNKGVLTKNTITKLIFEKRKRNSYNC